MKGHCSSERGHLSQVPEMRRSWECLKTCKTAWDGWSKGAGVRGARAEAVGGGTRQTTWSRAVEPPVLYLKDYGNLKQQPALIIFAFVNDLSAAGPMRLSRS